MAALDRRLFENLHPGRRIVFNLPVSDQELVRFAVLDSAMEIEDEVTCAAMLVPTGAEDDWIYSSEGGQWQLLSTASVARLTIVDRVGKPRVQEKSACLQCDDQALATRLRPVVTALAPRICFKYGVPVVPFVDYSHNIVHRVVVEESYSSLIGSMVVEDVAMDTASFDSTHADVSVETGCVHRQVRKADKVVYRRRLRFKRMPNLVQTEVPLVNSITCDRDAVLSNSQIDHSLLVHKYLPPIVAGLVLAASSIEPCMERGERVNVLALGVGGGALPVFLQKHLGFHVQAVDIDSVVLDLAHRHFGLQNGGDMEVEVGDALQIISKLAVKVTDEMADKKSIDHRVHVIVLDVDEGDARCGLSSPPPSFLECSFLSDARTVLHDGGMLAINVVPNGAKSHSGVMTSLLSVFDDVYETVVEDDVNRVVFALPSKCTGANLEGPLARLVTKFLDVRLITAIQKAHTE